MANRYFTQEIQDDRARIAGPDAHHLARVLRAKVGDALVLCDGMGRDYDAVVEAVLPEEVLLRVVASRPSIAEPSVFVEAYVGYAKGERMDWAVQKLVELGVGAIVPFFSARSVVKQKREEEKTARLNRIAQEAAKQCGRGVLPAVRPAVHYGEALRAAAVCEAALFFYEGGGASIRQALSLKERTIAIITGPEGGFTPEEAQIAKDAGCKAATLGPRILRCETAPAAALCAIMALSGNLE